MKKILHYISSLTFFISTKTYAQIPPGILPSEELLIEESLRSDGNQLPHGDIITVFIPAIIKIILQSTAILVLIAIVVAGIMFVTSRGEEEQLSKAKQIIYYALLGLVLISSAYAITLGISKLSLG